jgi:hypothetical protein
MVLAILSGAKTQTRRIVPLARDVEFDDVLASNSNESTGTRRIRNRYGLSGDKLWVKETWRPSIAHGHGSDACDCADVNVEYAADNSCSFFSEYDVTNNWKIPKAASAGWVTPLYMPKWASRITLEVAGVRVERLQDITEKDAQAEGARWTDAAIVFDGAGKLSRELSGTHRGAFACLWDSINRDRANWTTNPRVWVVEFRRIRP